MTRQEFPCFLAITVYRTHLDFLRSDCFVVSDTRDTRAFFYFYFFFCLDYVPLSLLVSQTPVPLLLLVPRTPVSSTRRTNICRCPPKNVTFLTRYSTDTTTVNIPTHVNSVPWSYFNSFMLVSTVTQSGRVQVRYSVSKDPSYRTPAYLHTYVWTLRP